MNKDYELYDENNPEHSNPELYEVMETHEVLNVVTVGTIEEDMKKRDFVNSCIYYSLKNEQLIDPSGEALKDCLENRLRFVGNPKDRIKEDSARVFRGYKFISRGWKADPKTLRSLRENFEYAVKNTNATRIMKEFEKIAGL